jgi:hypothetical protein
LGDLASRELSSVGGVVVCGSERAWGGALGLTEDTHRGCCDISITLKTHQ